ncbi:NAD(P)-binding protein [Parathielavia appendiculata]|uniref:NAD(P)-binding protein n=1 Tax=Parathielavia appendiculata TaxID=2587402 RepID=A0AAN6Z0P5_9PEZI|nr:NAD(P)-binding protein [Parathielavia appendiculata]
MSARTLLVVGSGPGIGRAVTTLFASKRYTNVVLVARRAESLAAEKAAIEHAVGPQVNVRTYAVDITDLAALGKALDDADAAIGKPECVFFNAARVLPSAFFEHDVKEIEYDLKITVSALYVLAQRYIPHLVSLAKAGADPDSEHSSSAKPGFLVTSSALPLEPIPQLFALSLVKAAQRNLVQSLHMAYAPEGVHVGVINVAGAVSPDDLERNPANIAARAWDWFEGLRGFEVVI